MLVLIPGLVDEYQQGRIEAGLKGAPALSSAARFGVA